MARSRVTDALLGFAAGVTAGYLLKARSDMAKFKSLAEALTGIKDYTDKLSAELTTVKANGQATIDDLKAKLLNAENDLEAAKAAGGETSESEQAFLDGVDKLINNTQGAGTDPSNPLPVVETTATTDAPTTDSSAGDPAVPIESLDGVSEFKASTVAEAEEAKKLEKKD